MESRRQRCSAKAGGMLKRALSMLGLWCLAFGVHALDFGAPHWISEPSAPLEVRVPITDLGGYPVNQLLPVFGSESSFARAGVERLPALSDLFHRIETFGAEPNLVIRLDSPWSEESLSTVVEVFTPKGVVILPVSVDRPAAVAMADRVSVANGDTLWRIAQRIQPEGASIEQVMMALFDANPQAFEIANVNALEKNTVLSIPPPAALVALEPIEAKRRFEAHMADPTRAFGAWTGISAPAIEGSDAEPVRSTAESAVAAPERQPAPLEERESPEPSSEAPVEPPVVTLESPANTDEETAVAAPAEAMPSAETVAALLDKIDSLENKLDQVTVRLSELAEVASRSVVTPEEPDSGFAVDWDSEWQRLLDHVPTEAELRAFVRTELGQGTVIFFGVLILLKLLLRVYGQPQHFAEPARASVSPPESGPSTQSMTPISAHADALEQAVTRLRQKIEDPNRLGEAEALYQDGDELLIDAFSAEALNEHPEWGEDPDDEAEVAAQQLLLAERYLEMGMQQTAIELLTRVAVSPHMASASKAKAMLETHRSA